MSRHSIGVAVRQVITRKITVSLCAGLLVASCAAKAAGANPASHDFNGAAALDYTRRVVAWGARPPGSPALLKLRAYLVTTLQASGAHVVQDAFVAQTPDGKVPMVNLIARFPGNNSGTGAAPAGAKAAGAAAAPRILAISGHYDTKMFRDQVFVGANDGGSSTGFLLELASVIKAMPHRDEIDLVFFDGEEAFHDWSETDSLYGSRHLSAKWTADGTLARLKALINVDMIGDSDLQLVYDGGSNAALRDLVWSVADSAGYSTHFPRQQGSIGDDHMPFIEKGVAALDLIDFSYGPNNSYWHTPQDTMDKLSAQSFSIVGTVVQAAIKKIEARAQF